MSSPSRSSPTPAAASAVLRPVMTGPPVPARVLAAFPDAIYLGIELGIEPADPDRTTATPPLISIMTARAAAQPGSLILPRGTTLPRCHPGMGAAIGGGSLVLGDVSVTPTRWWAAAPSLPPADARVLHARAAELQRSLLAAGAWDHDLHARADVLARSLLAVDHEATMRAGRRLLGYGPGLTPAGDDVLCGLLVAATSTLEAHRSGGTDDRVVAVRDAGHGIVEVARQVTTALSHGLLWHAVRGHAAGPVAGVLHALAGRAPLHRRLPALLAVGSTSGRDLAIGLSAGAHLAADLLARTDLAPAASPTARTSSSSEVSLHLDGRRA